LFARLVRMALMMLRTNANKRSTAATKIRGIVAPTFVETLTPLIRELSRLEIPVRAKAMTITEIMNAIQVITVDSAIPMVVHQPLHCPQAAMIPNIPVAPAKLAAMGIITSPVVRLDPRMTSFVKADPPVVL